MKVLIIDDDKNIVESLKITFDLCWPETKVVSTRLGEDGIQMIEEMSPDVVILDLGLPDISGFDVLKQVRMFSDIPVIILTVRGDEPDIVRGLGMGANDYIVKPFRQMEFIARVKANARKQNFPTEDTNVNKEPFRLNAFEHTLYFDNRKIVLTKSECIMFAELVKNSGTIVSYYRLSLVLWGREYPGSNEAIRVYIKRLREKIEDDSTNPKYIITKVGQGYILNLSPSNSPAVPPKK